jgi:hypothetical protein
MSELGQRLRTITLLLNSLLDYHPWPETAQGQLERRQALPGPGPHHRQPCTACNGTGRWRNRPCQTCLNPTSGRGRGWVEIDNYTDQPIATEATGEVAPPRRVTCDGCGGEGAHNNGRTCRHCSGRGTVPATPHAVDRDGSGDNIDHMLAALNRQARHRSRGVYRHLHRALAALEQHDPYGHFLVCWTYVLEQQQLHTMPPVMQFRVFRSLAWLSDQLPAKLQLPPEVAAIQDRRRTALRAARGNGCDRNAQRARDAEIRRLIADGWKVPRVAKEMGVTRERIYQVLRKTAA